MIRLIAVALTLVTLAAAGCGKTTDKKVTSTPATLTAVGSGTPTLPGSSPSHPAHDTTAAVGACKQAIASNNTLNAATKSKLTTICATAGSGNVKAGEQASRKVCVTIVESALAPGKARDRAEKSCRTTPAK